MGTLRLFSRRNFLSSTLKLAAVLTLPPDLSELSSANSRPGKSPASDNLLDELERRASRFFYDEADPATGLVKDRARTEGHDDRPVASIAATGFGLSALCIAAERRFLNRKMAEQRVETTLDFLLRRLPHEHGFFFHFVDMHSGERVWNCELSSIDTALLLLGVLHARTHFDKAHIRQLAAEIYERIDWQWMLNGGNTLSHGWKPESGFLKNRWDAYSEHMAMYLLAIGSPTHPIPASSWEAWVRPVLEYDGLKYITVKAPLFIHQYSHAWVDFRGKRDRHADYFENSRIATLAHKRFCIALHDRYPWFSDDLWGITASDSQHGYLAWGGPPDMGPVDGTIVPCAAGGSLPFLPEDCSKVLHTILNKYPQAWTKYGFVDAFHPGDQWYNADVIGIDQGISLLMAENLKSGAVWRDFMRNPEIGRAMKAVGFHIIAGATGFRSPPNFAPADPQ